MSFISKNPATLELLGEYPELSQEELENKLQKASVAATSWKWRTPEGRASKLQRVADLLRERKQRYGELMTCEMGKPIGAAMAEVEKCAWACEYYAEHAEKMLQPEIVETDAQKSYVRFDPLGVILAVMPWNFPFWQVIRFAAPTIAAGNVGLLKHASNVPQCAMAIEQLFRDAEFPEGVFQNLMIGSTRVAEVIEDTRVAAVTLTGSESAGMQVAATAGRVLKKTVLELGGSDPFIVLADADLVTAAKFACTARLQNAGQSCIAAKRFIVEEKVADEFVRLLKIEYEQVKIGNPIDPQITLGPVASEQILLTIEKQVNDSVAQGAKVVIGGKRGSGIGYFYEPTILEVIPEMIVAKDETFGPVAVILRVANAQQAIQLANATVYGLGASFWTRDLVSAEQYASQLQCGMVFINQMVKSDPRLPFGGVKRSGYGREMAGFGLKEFVNVKAVSVG